MIDEAALSVDRSATDIQTIFNLPGRITASDLPSPRNADGRWVGGSVRQWIEELTSAVLEFGAGGFILFGATYGQVDDSGLQRWAEEIAPAVREATGN